MPLGWLKIDPNHIFPHCENSDILGFWQRPSAKQIIGTRVIFKGFEVLLWTIKPPNISFMACRTFEIRCVEVARKFLVFHVKSNEWISHKFAVSLSPKCAQLLSQVVLWLFYSRP